MAQTQMQRDQRDLVHAEARDERSIGDLFSELATETSTLIRHEISLAQAEMTEKASTVGRNVGFLAVGGAVGYAALLALLAGVILGLTNFIPAWAAALVVGIVVGIVAYILIMSAVDNLKRTHLKPEETVESIKEDAKWLKNQLS